MPDEYDPHVVMKMWNTDHEGREIDPGKEPYPITAHGPFDTLAAAVQWMDDEPDDQDLFEAFAMPLNKPTEHEQGDPPSDEDLARLRAILKS